MSASSVSPSASVDATACGAETAAPMVSECMCHYFDTNQVYSIIGPVILDYVRAHGLRIDDDGIRKLSGCAKSGMPHMVLKYKNESEKLTQERDAAVYMQEQTRRLLNEYWAYHMAPCAACSGPAPNHFPREDCPDALLPDPTVLVRALAFVSPYLHRQDDPHYYLNGDLPGCDACLQRIRSTVKESEPPREQTV